MNASEVRAAWIVQGICASALLLLAVFWTCWFVDPGLVATVPPDDARFVHYRPFTDAFVLADGWLFVAALTCFVGLTMRRAWGALWAVVAGSSAIFLGLMDLCYDLQNRVFLDRSVAVFFEMVLVASALLGGTVLVVLGWRLRNCFGEVSE